MKRVAISLLCIAGLARAEGLSTRAEWLTYGTHYAVDSGSLFNPGNQLIRQPANIVNSELRPDFTWSNEGLTLNLKPRVLVERSAQGNEHDVWLNEANVRWRVQDELTLAAGREVLLWGPAQFWNPSNPFYTDNGKANAKREVFGKTFVRLRWQLGDGVNLHAIHQLDRGHADTGSERVDALKLDWVGSEASASALVAAEQGESPQWRGWVQWTLDDAWLLYGEAAWARRTASLAARAASPTGWRVTAADGRHAFDATVGASYTFLNGWTVNTEYFRHGAGFSDREMSEWNRLAVEVGDQLASTPLATGQLGVALNPGVTPLRRNYLGVQLRNGSDEKIGWNLRYARNLDDGSGQLVGQLSYDLSDHVQLWANTVAHHGTRQSEYGRWLKSTAMLGVTVFLW